MSRWHADNWSHPGHYLVDPHTWPLSPNGHGHEWPTTTPFVQCQSALPFWDRAISKFDHENPWSRSCVFKCQGHVWPWKFKGQGYGQCQTWWSHLRPRVQSICLLFVPWQSDHFGLRYSKILYLTLKIQGQGYGQGQTRWSHLSPRVQSICLLFASWQSDHFWLRYSKFYIWPWKFKVKVIAKVEPDGHFWALKFNRLFAFCFVAIWPYLAEI